MGFPEDADRDLTTVSVSEVRRSGSYSLTRTAEVRAEAIAVSDLPGIVRALARVVKQEDGEERAC